MGPLDLTDSTGYLMNSNTYTATTGAVIGGVLYAASNLNINTAGAVAATGNAFSAHGDRTSFGGVIGAAGDIELNASKVSLTGNRLTGGDIKITGGNKVEIKNNFAHAEPDSTSGQSGSAWGGALASLGKFAVSLTGGSLDITDNSAMGSTDARGGAKLFIENIRDRKNYFMTVNGLNGTSGDLSYSFDISNYAGTYISEDVNAAGGVNLYLAYNNRQLIWAGDSNNAWNVTSVDKPWYFNRGSANREFFLNGDSIVSVKDTSSLTAKNISGGVIGVEETITLSGGAGDMGSLSLLDGSTFNAGAGGYGVKNAFTTSDSSTTNVSVNDIGAGSMLAGNSTARGKIDDTLKSAGWNSLVANKGLDAFTAKIADGANSDFILKVFNRSDSNGAKKLVWTDKSHSGTSDWTSVEDTIGANDRGWYYRSDPTDPEYTDTTYFKNGEDMTFNARGLSSGNNLDSDFWGVLLYGRTSSGKWDFYGDLGYTAYKTDYDNLKGTADNVSSSLISVGVKAFYRTTDTERFAMGPFFGVRFNHYQTDDYTLTDGTRLESYEYNQWQFPLGMRFDWKFSEPNQHGWQNHQTLELSYIRAAGDVEVTRSVKPSGYSDSVSVLSALTDENSFAGEARFETKKNNFTGSLNLGGRLSSNQTDWDVGLTFKWRL